MEGDGARRSGLLHHGLSLERLRFDNVANGCDAVLVERKNIAQHTHAPRSQTDDSNSNHGPWLKLHADYRRILRVGLHRHGLLRDRRQSSGFQHIAAA